MRYEELKGESTLVLPDGTLVEVLDQVEMVRLRALQGDGLWLVFPDGRVFLRGQQGLVEAEFDLGDTNVGWRASLGLQTGLFYSLPDGTEVLVEGDQLFEVPSGQRWMVAADQRLYRLDVADPQIIATDYTTRELTLCETARQRELWRAREAAQTEMADQVMNYFARLLADTALAPPDSRVFGVARALVRQWLLWPWPADQVRQALAICGLLLRTTTKQKRMVDASRLEEMRSWLHACRGRESSSG